LAGRHQHFGSAIFIGLQTLGSKQLADVYLLGLAVSKSGKLATLDRSIPADAVRGGAALELIAT